MPVSLKEKGKSKILQVGDEVTISGMFFRNHGLKFQDIGKGVIKEIVPSWESKIPAVKAVFKFSPVILTCANSSGLKVTTFKDAEGFKMLVRIHPVYLEKCK